jgi:hypothetical protein
LIFVTQDKKFASWEEVIESIVFDVLVDERFVFTEFAGTSPVTKSSQL